MGGRSRPAQRKQPHPQRWIGKLPALLLALCAVFAATRACAEIVFVTTDADSGPGSFRAAINEANASSDPIGVSIFFKIPGPQPPTILPLSPYGFLEGNVTIFGTNNPNGDPNNPAYGKVTVRGPLLPAGSDGLRFQPSAPASGFTLSNLRIQDVPGNAIGYKGVDGLFHKFWVHDCVFENNGGGVSLDNAQGADIGTLPPFLGNFFPVSEFAPPAGPGKGGNVIFGNSFAQIQIIGGGNHSVLGNFIGTNAAGTAAGPGSNQGIYITDSINNMIGGWAAGQGNLISGNNSSAGSFGVFIFSSTGTVGGNTIAGNYIGVDITSGLPIPNSTGIAVLNSPNNLIQNNVISGNAASGVLIQGLTATGNKLFGNRIGTDATGLLKLGNGNFNVAVLSAPGNIIGGPTPGFGNIIAGAKGGSAGIQINSANTATIQGNFIGTESNGLLNLGNSGQGIQIFASSNMTIGGTAPGAGNLIGFNGAGGITLVDFGQPFPVNDAIRGNSIFLNSGFSGGIDLKGDGPTSNDIGDADDGPNHLQNFPVINTATTANGVTTIAGTLNSTASTAFAIDLFASAVSTASNREGQFFLGTVPVTTDGAGNASFSLPASIPAPVPAGFLITATATDPQGNTSEFASPVAVTGTAVAQDVALTSTVASTAKSGMTLTYIFTLKNLSASASGPLTFSDPLPVGLTFVSVTSNAGTTSNSGNTVTANMSSLAGNASATITITATVDKSVAAGTYLVNRALLTTNQPDPNPSNNATALATLVLPSPSIDVDGNSQYDALTDGLLLIRYLFGVTGTSLTNGAIGAGPTRTTPVEIAQYMDGIRPLLDVDGNGQADALTDGLMLIRYLFGLRGSSLISGAIGAGATRTTAAQIEAYIQSLTP